MPVPARNHVLPDARSSLLFDQGNRLKQNAGIPPRAEVRFVDGLMSGGALVREYTSGCGLRTSEQRMAVS
jgi:hypothetical protein